MNGILSGSCILEFKLSQLTPLIHFKNETGKTVRATEMKPKLDRYISHYVQKNKIESKQEWLLYGEKNWISLEDHKANDELIAYDYKLRIKAGTDQSGKRYYKKRNKSSGAIGAYFWTGDDPRYNSYCSEITVEILCKHKGLKVLIQDIFPEFIAGTTFGFRQDKGYGYFFVEQAGKTVKKQEQLIKNYMNTFNDEKGKRFQLYKLNNTGGTYDNCLVKIRDFNRDLKSGGQNSESFMLDDYLYTDRASIIHEKNAMRQMIKNTDLKGKGEIWYIRGLLGFADHYEFSKKEVFKVRVYENGEEQKKFRFPSPMRFIPAVDFNTVFLLFDIEAVRRLQEKTESLNVDFEFSKGGNFIAKIPGSKKYNVLDMLDSYSAKREKFGLNKIN